MKTKRFLYSVLFFIGFILSPLTWWNDPFVNIPIAYAVSFLFSLIDRRLFLPSFVGGYLLTNVTGFILMHIGIQGARRGEQVAGRNLKKDILISFVYVVVIVLLVKLGWLKVPTDYVGPGRP
jgi:Na+/H+-translocating membrane pyrophosphatase